LSEKTAGHRRRLFTLKFELMKTPHVNIQEMIPAPKGFRAAGGAGLKKSGDRDMALIFSDTPCAMAGTSPPIRSKPRR
jgi:N-acetylglutamate synthase/N-acetylornithine aminotransferase